MTRNIFLSASLPEGASVTITKTITKTKTGVTPAAAPVP